MENKISHARQVKISSLLGLPDIHREITIPCPIHNGKNNNFHLYPDNHYHCFKCNAHGFNAIDFVMALDASFIEAVEQLDKFQ